MAFDQKTRNLLQRTVTACRRAFDREFTAQLQELYGIQPNGSLTPCAELDHLADEELEVARLLRSRINHLEGGEPAEALTRTHAKPEHVARVIREQAFTVLNRLAALRLCEERGLVLECVRRSVNSEGFQLFLTSAGNALGETHEAYRVYLHCVFDELAVDLGVLFDRFSPLALLFPRKDALEEVLRELNGSGKAAESEVMPDGQFAEVWQADEAIGWIYQYYNDEAERKKMREESSAPRNSRELAVRNQFFTPRYVVEFLTDNTLGRLWYEMTRGQTALRDRCRYLVRRPVEIFLKPGESEPESHAGGEAQARGSLSQEELLRKPVSVPHRPLKDPREIRLLDPACGSMHFGLYGFDLFTSIYEEAWEMAHCLDDAAKSAETFAPFVTFVSTFPDKAAFLLEVPRLIIERNIHGIDIDPRAAQIAGLSLWLRAQRAWHQAGLKPSDRPRITRSNLVCAEPMPGEKELLHEFVEQQFVASERPAFAFLLEKIFDRMTLAGEAGSLLRIEEEIRATIAEARVLAQSQSAPWQTGLWAGDERPGQSELDLRGLNDEQFWRTAERRIYDALEAYAEKAENGGGFQRRLFADDTAQGFAFIDLCRKRYDVVVMNPPFGEETPETAPYIDAAYPTGKGDLYSVFVDRGVEYLLHYSRLGVISSRTGFFAPLREKWREATLLSSAPIEVVADLGSRVLDTAMVDVAAYVLQKGCRGERADFIDLRDAEDKGLALIHEVRARQTGSTKRTVVFDLRMAKKLPRSGILYDASPELLESYLSGATFEGVFGPTRNGFGTLDDFRFLRASYEVPASVINRTWFYTSKGAVTTPFYGDNIVLFNWKENGVELKRFVEKKVGSASRKIQSERFYFTPGLTWGRRSIGPAWFSVLPAGCAFTDNGPIALVPPDKAVTALGICNSSRFRAGLRARSSRGGKGSSATKVIETGHVASCPVPSKIAAAVRTRLEAACTSGISAAMIAACYELESSLSVIPPVFAKECRDHSLSGVLGKTNRLLGNLVEQINSALDEIDSTVSGIADFGEEQSSEDSSRLVVVAFVPSGPRLISDAIDYLVGSIFGRWDIRYAKGELPVPKLPDPLAPLRVCPPGMLQGGDGLPLSPETGRLLRAEGRYPLDVAWDGILVEDPEHLLDMSRSVHAALAAVWADRADSLEHEACTLLGVPTLREWFRRSSGFFADHLKRYSTRRWAPIYWPLSIASGRYTLWLYYHRLTPDTLYKCLQRFVAPKLADLEKELAHLRRVIAANESGPSERQRLEELEGLRRELLELRTELELWAPKWKPDLNDGVLITAAPLWKLFLLPKWQKDLKACWQELEKGDYDWAHLAHTLWPDRVREKCKTDRSLAIAHGLEELCEVKVPVKKVRKTKLPEIEDNQQELPED